MFTRILVPLDGSILAEGAFRVATRLAHTTGGSVVAVRIVAPPTRLWPSTDPLLPSAVEQTVREARRIEASAYLEQLVQANHTPGGSTYGEVHSGPPAATILSLAEAHGSDLIIMSRYGTTGVSRWGLGSVTEKVARHTCVPVLILPENAGNAGNEQVWQALVPLDGSYMAEAALAPASHIINALSSPGRALLNLFLVATLPAPPDGKSRPEQRDEGMHLCMCRETSSYLQAVQERFLQDRQADHRVTLTSSLQMGTDVAGTLLAALEQSETTEAARDLGAQWVNLVALTTCGQAEGNHPWMMGHVTARILSATHLPLLLVPPPYTRRAEQTSDRAQHALTRLHAARRDSC